MRTAISASRIATLLVGFDQSPRYLGIAEGLRELIVDGRIPRAAKLPSEREMTGVLGVSRTTVTRAYAELCSRGYAEARRGSGTWTRLPDEHRSRVDRMLTPRGPRADQIDLNCAASSSLPGLAGAFEAASQRLPAYLEEHGYYPGGLPQLQSAIADRFDRRGLSTTPDQIIVVPGALAGVSVVAHTLITPGDRVLVEAPAYPNAVRAFTLCHARVVEWPVEAGDTDSLRATLRQRSPRAAYVLPDFQNPTGLLMTSSQRRRLAQVLTESRTLAVVDESHQPLSLDDVDMPPPLAAFVERAGGSAVTIGSCSKMFWGGLRVGWIRASLELQEELAETRLAMDLGCAVLEQLVAADLLSREQEILAEHRQVLRSRRAALVSALHEQLPQWEFTVPAGGLALWCRLPLPLAQELAVAAEHHGVVVSPGPLFSTGAGFASWVRVPWTRPEAELAEGVRRLALAWDQVTDGAATSRSRSAPLRRPGPMMIA